MPVLPAPARTPLRAWNRALVAFAVLSAVLAVGFAGGIALDTREVLGAPVWVKPLKFSLSFLLYAGTLAWMLSLAGTRSRLVRVMVALIVGSSLVEMAVIAGQAARGRASHFNIETGLDNALFSVMGTAVIVLYVATIVIAVVVWRRRLGDPLLTWGVRLGLAIAIVGMGLGALMLRPTPEQVASVSGGVATAIGAHSVGVADGGSGLAFLGWSTEGGDLRIGHFVGMHALQALPFAALMLGRLGRGLGVYRQVRLLQVIGGAYLGVVGLVTWQALRAQPLLQPDGLTLAAAGLLTVATAVGAGLALRSGRAGGNLATAA